MRAGDTEFIGPHQWRSSEQEQKALSIIKLVAVKHNPVGKKVETALWEMEEPIMKKLLLLGLVPLAALVLAQCAAGPQRWPEYERMADSRMMVIQDKIGDGLKTGALTPAQAQAHLARLEDLRREYRMLRDKPTYREEWDSFFRRLQLFEDEMNRDVAYPSRIDVPPPRIDDRIIAVQRRIDDARATGRLTPAQGRDYQARLDAIRADYSRMMEGRPVTYEERVDIARRLDLLEADLSRYP